MRKLGLLILVLSILLVSCGKEKNNVEIKEIKNENIGSDSSVIGKESEKNTASGENNDGKNLNSDVKFKISDNDEFEKIKNEGKPFVVMFGAEYCHFCKSMRPYVEKYANQFRDKINIRYVDVSEGREIAAKYPSQAIPAIIYMNKDGSAFIPSDKIKKKFVPFNKRGEDKIGLMMTIGFIDEEIFKTAISELIENLN